MNTPWTLVYTFFRSLTLDHLERSLYSLSRQTVKPDEYVFFDNNTDYPVEYIRKVVEKYPEIGEPRFVSDKHKDPKKTTASWCQNTAIRLATHDTFILGKADLIYDFTFCERLLQQYQGPRDFVTTWLYQMPYLSKASHEQVNHQLDLEPLNWRENVKHLLKNNVGAQEHIHTGQDAPSYITSKKMMELAGWYDEHLLGWGYWQLDLQRALREKGVQTKVIPEFLMFHMMHQIEVGERNLQAAQREYDASPRRKK